MDIRGKTLALVGGAGLIGSHTAERLLRRLIDWRRADRNRQRA